MISTTDYVFTYCIDCIERDYSQTCSYDISFLFCLFCLIAQLFANDLHGKNPLVIILVLFHINSLTASKTLSHYKHTKIMAQPRISIIILSRPSISYLRIEGCFFLQPRGAWSCLSARCFGTVCIRATVSMVPSCGRRGIV